MKNISRNSQLFNLDLESIKKTVLDANIQLFDIRDQLLSRFGALPQSLDTNDDEVECLKLVEEIEDILKDSKKTRLKDGKPFRQAAGEIKNVFDDVDDPLKFALQNLRHRLTKRAFDTKDNPLTDAEYQDNENIINLDDFATTDRGESIVKSSFASPNISLSWKIADFDINTINLEELRHYFSETAVVAALKKHLKDHGPHKVNGVKYEQSA
tara:strand:- start:446 stop:1081 length:636 start_codon:yes stop_codon:yes gene_type:complete